MTDSEVRTRPRRVHLRCPATLTELRTVRRRVQRWARGNGLPDEVLVDLQLAVGEAVSNGIEHAYGHEPSERGSDGCDASGSPPEAPTGPSADAYVEVELELRTGDGGAQEVAARVSDRGHWRRAPTDPGYRGRGLALIAQLSRDLRVQCSGRGTRVTFAIAVTS